MPADVAMAFLMLTLHHIKNGTLNEPPPIATNADKAPMKEPTKESGNKLGTCRDGLGFLLTIICNAINAIKTENSKAKGKVGI